MFHALYGLPVVIVRPFMTYGPRQRASKLIPSLTLSLLRGAVPTVNQPDREVDWVYVKDVAEGILAAGLARDVDGRTIDLGSGVLVPIREVEKALESLVRGVATHRVSTAETSIANGRRADTECARHLLGWAATTPLVTGLEQTVAWYRATLAEHETAS
jgi:nucleoside-diphosphate-sugar epimerase